MIVIFTYGVSQFFDYAITDNRYPLNVEYSVMDSCINAYEEPLLLSMHRNKTKVCLCAVEETMNEISYTRYMIDKKGFLSAFENNAEECTERQQ